MAIERSEHDSGPNDSGGDDYDIVIVGGGVSGPSAGIYTARAGMDTCILDRGPSSLARCAYLANYPGFPGGIDVPTFRALCRAHAEAAGCRYISDMVVSVRREDTGDDDQDRIVEDGANGEDDENEDGGRTSGNFLVETADGRAIETPRVMIATKDDTTYLEALNDEAMFVTESYGGETARYFDSEYVDDDGRTRVPGLYVTGPLSGCLDQAITSAGHGATVGFSVITDWLVDRGYPRALARGYWDWLSKAKPEPTTGRNTPERSSNARFPRTRATSASSAWSPNCGRTPTRYSYRKRRSHDVHAGATDACSNTSTTRLSKRTSTIARTTSSRQTSP